jgi:hypothetical protein
MYRISKDQVDSIKRVMSTDYYIFKIYNNLKLLDFKSEEFLVQDLLEIKDKAGGTESLHVQITPTQIVIAASQS